MLQLNFYNITNRKLNPIIFTQLLKKTEKMLLIEKVVDKSRHLSIELTLVDEHVIKKLNRIYHRKNRVTDVISLSFFEKSSIDPFAGEIFICLPYAEKQAKKIGQPLYEELRFLFIHGLLHLFGYDHKKSAEEAHMEKITYRILGRKWLK